MTNWDANWVIALFTVVLVVITAVYAFVTYKILHATQRQAENKLTDRIYQIDTLLIQYPELQEILYKTINNTTEYFTPATVHTADYFRLKPFIYCHLNFFDEIFVTFSDDKVRGRQFELDDWETHILNRMRHPLFRELFEKESRIFGQRFREFIKENEERLKEAPDPEAY